MDAADRSFIRQINRAFGPIEWTDDPLDMIFECPLADFGDEWDAPLTPFGIRPPMNHTSPITAADFRRKPLDDDFKPFRGWRIDKALSALPVHHVHDFGCPYGNSRCPKPHKGMGAGHHAGCLHADDRYRIESVGFKRLLPGQSI